MILAGLSAYAGSEPEAIPAVMGRNLYLGSSSLLDQTVTRVMAAYAVVVGLVHSHGLGHPFSFVDGDGSYLSNLLLMMGLGDETAVTPDANRASLIGKLWILGANHELTNSTSALLHVASTLTDPISCSLVPLHPAMDLCTLALRRAVIESCSRLVLRAMWPNLSYESRRASNVSWVLGTECIRTKIHESRR